MLRVTSVWSGFSGAPGYTNLYFGGGVDGIVETSVEAGVCATRTRAFFNAMVGLLPSGLQITVLPTVAKLDEGSGDLEDEFTVNPAPTAVVGTAVGNYAAPAGACVNWRTATIISGRRLRGRTFLVPLSSGAFFSDGTPSTAALTTINAAANELATGPVGLGEPLVVWARPTNGAGGAVGRAVSGNAADKAAILRSRRD